MTIGSKPLRYVNCGHNPPILLRSDGAVERLEATATVLGLFEEWDCTVEEKQLAPGDVLVIYTGRNLGGGDGRRGGRVWGRAGWSPPCSLIRL